MDADSWAQKVHIPNFASIADCELIALAEVRSELGTTVQKRFGIPRLYAEHRELAQDAEIEAVAVSADFALQGEIAKDLLLAGKHVFMEKPMAVSIAQAEAIVNASRTSGKKLMVGYMKRYDAGNEIVKAKVTQFRESGELGRLTYARNHGFGGDWVCNLDTQMDSTDEPKPSAPIITPEMAARTISPLLFRATSSSIRTTSTLCAGFSMPVTMSALPLSIWMQTGIPALSSLIWAACG